MMVPGAQGNKPEPPPYLALPRVAGLPAGAQAAGAAVISGSTELLAGAGLALVGADRAYARGGAGRAGVACGWAILQVQNTGKVVMAGWEACAGAALRAQCTGGHAR